MSSRYDDQDDRRAKRVVDETAEHVQSTRNRFYQQHLEDPLAISVAQWWDVLKKHRDDNSEVWEDYDLDQIRTLIFQTTTAQRPAAGDTQATQAVEVPMLDALSRAQLLDLSDRLDDFAKDIGFAAQTRDTTPDDDGSLEDLDYLLRARGQTEAADRLPDSEPEVSIE